MSTNIIYYILHKILFIGLRAPISLLDVKDTGRENVHRFGSRGFSEPELEKHKYPSILDTEEHFYIEEHLRKNTYIFVIVAINC